MTLSFIFFIIGSVSFSISFIFYSIREKILNHIKMVIENNIVVKAEITNKRISISGDEGDISFLITYSYFWEGTTYKTCINTRKNFYESVKDQKNLYVYLDYEKPEKTYLDSGKVIYTSPIVLFVLWIVFMFDGLGFLLTAGILYIITIV